MDTADLRAARIASASLSNDVANLKRCVEANQGKPVREEAKAWAFAGHQGSKVIVDKRPPAAPQAPNPTYAASSWKVGERATEVNPVTGQHAYNTGNLYRTVHWKEESFGLNGEFTNSLAQAGMWKHDGLNTNPTRSKVVADPTQWGTQKEGSGWMM